jgi:hypothetical protein
MTSPSSKDPGPPALNQPPLDLVEEGHKLMMEELAVKWYQFGQGGLYLVLISLHGPLVVQPDYIEEVVWQDQ